MKKIIPVALIAVALILGASADATHAATSSLTGWAWSSNVGWISFNGSQAGAGGGSYSVTLSTTTPTGGMGTLGGYAWSPNVGWISFNPTVNNTCPGGTGCTPQVDMSTGEVVGWARALVGCQSDLWDGTRCTGTGPGNNNGTSAVGAATVTTLSSVLPTGKFGPSCAAASNGKVYCFGGNNTGGIQNQIVEFNVAANTVAVKSSVLPVPAYNLSCAQSSVNGYIYCFGGLTGGGSSAQVVEYNPVADTISTKAATLPSPRYGLSCANASNGKIYCFGGNANSTILDSIVEYNPSTGSITTKSAQLPTGRYALSCASSSSGKIYCFGGGSALSTASTQIVEYNPSANSVSVKSGTFSYPGFYTSCAQNPLSDKIYCFGGATSAAVTNNQILEYSPSADTATIASTVLPSARYGLSCANSSNGTIYCFGGNTSALLSSALDKIVKYEFATANSGWDGWISLSGTNHSSPTANGAGGVTFTPATGAFDGYAWGSDILGWVKFSTSASTKVSCPGCGTGGESNVLTFSASSGGSSGRSLSVAQGSVVNFSWAIENLENCTRTESPTGYWTTINPSNSVTGDHISSYSGSGTATFNTIGRHDFGIACEVPGSMPLEQSVETVTITVTAPQPLTCVQPARSNQCSATGVTFDFTARPDSSYPATDLRNVCPTSGGPYYCVYYCQTGYEKNGNRCVISDLEEF